MNAYVNIRAAAIAAAIIVANGAHAQSSEVVAADIPDTHRLVPHSAVRADVATNHPAAKAAPRQAQIIYVNQAYGPAIYSYPSNNDDAEAGSVR